MRKVCFVGLAFALLCVMAPFQATAQRAEVDAARVLTREAIQAYQSQDYDVFLQKTIEAEALRPGHPTLVYNLAAGHALVGNHDEAYRFLGLFVEMGLIAHPEQDSDFDSIKEEAEFQAILGRIVQNGEAIGEVEEAFRLSDPHFIPEGIALDSQTEAFYLGSVHTRRIVRIDDRGAHTFADSTDGLWSVLGMAADVERRKLWVCTAALDQTRNVDDAEHGRTALYAFDLDEGTVRHRIELPPSEGPQVLGDIVLSEKGDVYLSDGRSGGVYQTNATKTALEPILEPGTLISPQGMVLFEAENQLLIADYSLGLVALNLSTEAYSVLEPPPNSTLLGIDGLTRSGNTLVAIQNGVRPHRILRVAYNPEKGKLTEASVLSANHAQHDEPTLGMVVNGALYYVANSQWGHFKRDGSLPPADELVAPLVLKVPLW